MDENEAKIESSEVNRHLFREESAFQKKRFFLYCSLILFTVLLVVTFFLLNAGLAFALTCGVSIGISTSFLSLSLLRVGSRSFWIYFVWFLAVLLILSWFNIPEAVNGRLQSLGVPQDVIILGTVFQVVLFFLFIIYTQCRDFRRKLVDPDSPKIPLDKKLRKKSVQPKKSKAKSSPKGLLKKFRVNKEKAQSISSQPVEPENYSEYRKLALKLGFSLIGVSALTLIIFSGIHYMLPFTFAAMFMVTFLLMMVPMIKPNTKSFWYGTMIVFLLLVPTFIIAIKLSHE